MKKLRTIFICLLPGYCFSQAIRNPVSSNYIGLGAYSTNQVDAFSVHTNQAALATIKSAAAGVYCEKRFLLKELSVYNASIVMPAHYGNFGLDMAYSGFSDYNETQAGLAYARNLGAKVDLGVQFDYYSVRVAGYGSASSVNFELGTIFHLTDRLNTGLHVYNPLGSKLGKNDEERLASIYSAGIGYEPAEQFFISVEIQKEEDRPVNINVGMQYKFLAKVLARGGISSSTSSLYFGIGYEWRSFRLDASACYSQLLGFTPGFLLLFNFNSEQN